MHGSRLYVITLRWLTLFHLKFVDFFLEVFFVNLFGFVFVVFCFLWFFLTYFLLWKETSFAGENRWKSIDFKDEWLVLKIIWFCNTPLPRKKNKKRKNTNKQKKTTKKQKQKKTNKQTIQKFKKKPKNSIFM